MIEPPREASVAFLRPELAYRVGQIVATLASGGDHVRVIETARSLERQEYLYAAGRTRPGPIVTRAQPGASKHTPNAHGQASACDLCFMGPEPFAPVHPWALLGALAEQLGLTWGGRFSRLPDLGHVELP